MLAVKKIVQLMTLLCVGSILCLSGCGDAEPTGETIFVHVLNAYPGASKLTLYGPTGKVASGLPFGQRSEEGVLVDRNTNSEDFMLILDGAPTAIEFNKQLFSLYPQETVTMVITRRSGEEAAEVSLFRNTRTFSPTCVWSFANSLSLDNNFLPSDLISYSYQTEWEIVDQDFYVMNDETEAETRCGRTPIRTGDRNKRQVIIDGVTEDPWFYPIQGVEGYEMRWAIRMIDPRTNEKLSMGLTVGGGVRAHRDSSEFVECMSAAVTVLQEEDENDPEGAEQCPEGEGPMDSMGERNLLTTGQVIWDEIAVAECLAPLEYSGFPIQPGAEETYTSFSQRSREVDGQHICGYPIRVRTPIQDLIFQNKDNTVPNYIDNIGGFVQVDAVYPIAEQHYFILFGRPINPFVHQWNTAEESIFSDGQEFPYPEDAVPQYKR